MNAVTARTCDYGYARTAEGCVRTLASFNREAYVRVQVLYFAFGLVSLGASSYKYILSVRNGGAKLQQRTFQLCIFCGVTFLLRGVDPGSYGAFLPRPLEYFIVDACTAALYSVFIMSMCFWISIIRKGAAPTHKSMRLRTLEYSLIGAVWLFKVAFALALIPSRGYDRGLSAIELFCTATLLCGITITSIVYGNRVVRRLEHIDKMNSRRLSIETQFETLQTTRTIDPFAASHASTMRITELEKVVKKCKKKPARRMREMLIITSVMSFTCVIAQVTVAVLRSNSDSIVLQCANGFNCDKVKRSISLLHVFQFVAVFVVLYTFRKTKRRNAAAEFGLTRPVQQQQPPPHHHV
ncbi:hypothetical protein PINS_up010959 [Pythium insidiosum]|nr:hypothetical protein PINS_up010959 [Pythium insidiosum]